MLERTSTFKVGEVQQPDPEVPFGPTPFVPSIEKSAPPKLGRSEKRRAPPIYVASTAEVAADENARVVYQDRTTTERRLSAADVASVPFDSGDLDTIAAAAIRRIEKKGLDDRSLPWSLRIDGIAKAIHRELFQRFGSSAQYPRICDVATAVGQRVFDETGIDARSMWTRDLHHFLEVSDPTGERFVVDFTQAQFEKTPLSRAGHAIVAARNAVEQGRTPDLDRVEAEMGALDLARLTDVERGATLELLQDLLAVLTEDRPRVLALRDALIRDQIDAAKTAPVPQRVQHFDEEAGDREGNCGFYALGMVMDAHHAADSRNPAPWVQDKDGDDPRHASFEPTTDERMLDWGYATGLTQTGEMFDAALVEKLAGHFGYQARVHRNADKETLYEMVDRGQPAMVAIDVGPDGNPREADGKLAHFVVIEGRFELAGQKYVVARHGWGVEKDHVWKEDDFLASWNGLKTTDYYDPPRDISYGLGSAIIEVLPRYTAAD